MRALIGELHARELILLPSRVEQKSVRELKSLYEATSQESTSVNIFEDTFGNSRQVDL